METSTKEIAMKKNLFLLAAGSIASLAFLTCAPHAMAREQVDWSVSIGSANAYPPPPPPVVYRPPQVVYHAPLYVAPPPRVYYGPYYEREWRERQWREHRRHERHHHHHHYHR